MLIRNRILAEADYIVEHKATIRATARFFEVSKSVVYVDVTKRLETINYKLAMQVKEVLRLNKAERHIRGGNSTKEKYKKTDVKG